MMKLLQRIWYFFFGEPDHTNAVKSMNKALRKLERASAYQSEKAAAMEAAAVAAKQQAANAADAAKKAGRVREKLGDLLEA